MTFLTDYYERAPGSFIYSLRNKDGLSPFQCTLKDENDQNAICGLSNSGPRFGYGVDLDIANDAGLNNDSYTNFGYTYNLPHGYTCGETNTDSLLGGSYFFSPSELEVLYLN